ncbi:DUF4157 domain-containing protein [Actinomadura graeca]|uniref:DUF4157 domain-containing protein n=1 Tax=Actinomadura graeca TaxID=2750812 RepID=A0ABX8QYV1_9ACTN|nr:DUF4157 domain-containing protein [Actinomadura graeca]QXJ22882.1 DUF4157 domain-containing protein [Actinomadura graeca]
MALQRMAGNAAVARFLSAEPQAGAGLGQEETALAEDGPAVQRKRVERVLRSPGRPLDEPVRTEMEARFGTDFSDVRVHTDTSAHEAAESVQAEAFTSGSHIAFRRDRYSPNSSSGKSLLGHELVHVQQNRDGLTAGTDNGHGLLMTHPSHDLERAADTESAAALGRPVSLQRAVTREEAGSASDLGVVAPDIPVQRYVVVQPGDHDYPRRRRVGQSTSLDETFTSQEMINNSFVGPDGEINVRYTGRAPLRISEKKDLAVEHNTGSPFIQAKSFFATQERIAQANQNLQGRVNFQTGSHILHLRRTTRSLLMRSGEEVVTLWEVEPAVAPTHAPAQSGLDVRLPQRCDDMAQQVTGMVGIVGGTMEDRYWEGLAAVLGDVTKTSRKTYLDEFYGAKQHVIDSLNLPDQQNPQTQAAIQQAKDEYSHVMQSMLQIAMRERTQYPDDFKKALWRRHLNEYTPPAAIGDVLMIKALRPDGTSGSVDFHYGGVIAKSGTDYITMENYARHEGTETLSSNDPQWYFQMYGAEKQFQSWHEQWDWDNLFPDRVTLSVLLRG